MLKHSIIVFFGVHGAAHRAAGAIPYGVAFGLPLWQTYIIAIVGNMLPVPIIYFFARRVLEWGEDKPVIGRFFTFCLVKGERAGESCGPRRGGVYSGRCCCSWASRCREQARGRVRWPPACCTSTSKKSVLACMGGVVLAGIIMGALSVAGVSVFGAVTA